MELHVLKKNGREMVILLDDEMRIVKPVYDYLNFQRQRDKALNTLKANGTDLKIYWDFLNDSGYEYDKVTPNMIAEFIEYLRVSSDDEIALYKESKRTNKSINRILSTIHMFYQFEADMQEIDNPMLSHDVNRSSNTFKGILEHVRSDNRTKQSIFKVKNSDYRVNLVSDDEMQLFLGHLDKRRDILLYKTLYLINNCILIASQRPDASCVCGYKTWQTEFNRTVNRNESGIMIIAPVKYKVDVDEPIYDVNSHPVMGDDGKQKTEKVTKEFQAFRPAYVFDVQQTSGDPLPCLVHLLQGGVQDYEAIKSALIEISPVPVAFEPISGGANGFYSPGEKRIVVKDDLAELQTIKTLIHEIAHAELGHGGEEDKFDRKTKEVQAESVAYWVAAMIGTDGSDDYGLDTSDYSFGYISGWSKDKEVTELKESLDLIKETADRISMNLEKALAKTQTKQEAENIGGESEEAVTETKRKKVR